MSDGIKITLDSHISEAIAKMNGTAHERMTEAVNEVRNVALETLSGHRSGRTYYVPGTRRQYTASAPGEAPAVATAELRQSIKAEVEGQGADLVGMVGTDKKKGPMLEFGTKKIAPRPWLRVSFEKAEEKVKAIFGRPWLK